MAVIYITEADNTQHKFRLPADTSEIVTIGRNEDCTVSMPGILGLSGLHCSISCVGGVYVIKDEGSSNGTMVGVRAVSSEPLREGVAYRLGTAMLYFDPEVAVAAPEPYAAPAPDPYAAPAPAPAPVSGVPRVVSLMPAAAPAPAPISDVPPMDTPAPAPAPVVQEAPAAAPAEETLAEPIPVSEYAAYAEPAAVEETPAEQDTPAAPVKRKRKASKRVAFDMSQLSQKEQIFNGVNIIYLLIALAFAFYAGLTLRHWMETGENQSAAEPAPAETAGE